MSSFDKTVKLACKPKAAPPKAKYLDPIIAATWSDGGAVSDICKALSPRLREPNAIIVFKALIVLHTMMRNGSTDNVLSYLSSSSDSIRLRNVSAGNWEGYAAPQNLQHYALYLDARIRAYRELKHDAIRVQAENNRDLRNSLSMEEETQRSRRDKGASKTSNNGPQRSKTLMGRKLGSMTVEKGLLRETRMVQKMIDALVDCRFYLDDLEDELTITALRMLVKDLLILVQACNEGVINVLERYFEMSHTDAQQALELYRHFVKQTNTVDEYLGVAKKLQNLLNVSIPTLKSAPNSLAGALQEYLDDPNFEQNRKEYKQAKAGAERNAKSPMPRKTVEAQPQAKPAQGSTSMSATVSSEVKSAKKEDKDAIDFFTAIEEEQPNLSASSPNFAAGPHNPFSQMGFSPAQSASPFPIHPTGQIPPQLTAFPLQSNPFGIQNLQQLPAQQPFSPFMPSQPTGVAPSNSVNLMQGPSNPFSQPQVFGLSQPQQQPVATMIMQQSPTTFPTSQLRPHVTGFLQSQATGANPFRQSTLVPQTTGMALFGVGAPNGLAQSTSFGGPIAPAVPAFAQSQSAGASTFSTSISASPFSPTPFFGQPNAPSNFPPRPASTPLTFISQTSPKSPPQAQPVQTHQTGSRNPFGPITRTPPPVPRAPTLMELATGIGQPGPTANATSASQPQPQGIQSPPLKNTFSFNSGALNPGATDMSSVASSFALSNNIPIGVNGISGWPNTTPQSPGSTQTNPLPSSTLSGQPTGAGSTTNSFFSSTISTQPTGTTSSAFSTQATGTIPTSSSTVPPVPPVPTGLPPVKSHLTGFAGLKPFKPTSSFGAALMESLPPIPDNAQTNFSSPISSPTTITQGSVSSGLGASNSQQTGLSGLQSQPTGTFGSFSLPRTTLGQGLRPQMTGGGASNPFRASMAVSNMTGAPGAPSLPAFSAGTGFGSSSMPFTMSGSQVTGAGLFGSGGSGLVVSPSQPQQQTLI